MAARILSINYLPCKPLAQDESKVVALAVYEGRNCPLWLKHEHSPKEDGRDYVLYIKPCYKLYRGKTFDDALEYGHEMAFTFLHNFAVTHNFECPCPECTEERTAQHG